jgi:hypothetical protein
MTTKTIKRRYNQYSIEFEDMICEQYLQGKSSVMLQKEYKISPDTVLKLVRSRGYTPRTFTEAYTKYTFNHNFFENIDTEAKAYFLGFMVADGHVGTKEVILDLGTKDRHIIEEFVTSIEGNNKIADKQCKSNFNTIEKPICYMSRLNLRSDKMIADLNNLGLTRNKTYDVIIPKVKKELERHFWRGVMDGDGYVSVHGKIYTTLEVGICGHINTVTAFSEFLKRNNIKSTKIFPDHSIFAVRVSGSKYALKFLDLIYKDSDPKLCLKRKHEKYLEYLEYKKVNEKSKELF